MPFKTDVRRAGLRLLDERKRREWTQDRAAREVYEVTGVKMVPQEISRLEKGQTEFPSMESLCALGATYGMDASQMADLYGYTLGRRMQRPTELQLLNLDKLRPEERAEVLRYVQTLADVAVEQLVGWRTERR